MYRLNVQTFQKDDKLQLGGVGSDVYRSYLQLDLTGLPVGVSDATLMFYAFPRGDNSTLVNFNIWRPNVAWASSNLTTSMIWGNQPTSSLVGSYSPGPNNSWWYLPITSTYKAWRSGSTNNGLAFMPLTNNNNFNVWRSSRYIANDGQRPILRLTFTPPVTVPPFKMPLPRNVQWLVTTEAGGWDCAGSAQDPAHSLTNYFSIDFSWQNKNASGIRVYGNPISDGANIPIAPAADGQVVEVNSTNPNAGPDGLYVVVSHDPSHNAGIGYSTRYLHMKNVFVQKGATVYRDSSILGYMGSSGVYTTGPNAGKLSSTGPHLHFGMRYNNDGSANTNVMYSAVSGWLMKSFQSECLNGQPNRYYTSN